MVNTPAKVALVILGTGTAGIGGWAVYEGFLKEKTLENKPNSPQTVGSSWDQRSSKEDKSKESVEISNPEDNQADKSSKGSVDAEKQKGAVVEGEQKPPASSEPGADSGVSSSEAGKEKQQ